MKIINSLIFFATVLYGQWWPPAVNLGIPGADDINPQACRRQADHTGMAWQTNIGGNWEIFTRFHRPVGWGDTVRITNNSLDDCYPSIVYDTGRNCYWCAWQKDTAGFWNIYVVRSDSSNHWLTPVRISATGDNEHPSIFVIGTQVWTAWQNNSTPPVDIIASYYNGSTWSTPMPVTQDSIFDNILPKIGDHNNHPFVVWQRDQDIYRSEYSGSAWQPPQAITSDPAIDSLPELTNPSSIGGGGMMVFWESDRNGNWDIYRTGTDSFNVNIRVTTNPADDLSPNSLNYIGLTERGLPGIAFASNRSGNYDIYFIGYFMDTVFVDTNYSSDISPVMTGGDWFVCILWQSDRNGDWDIYGSRAYMGEIGEQNCGANPVFSRVYPNPFRTQTDIRFQITDNSTNTDDRYGMIDISSKIQKLHIYDISGRQVKSFTLSDIGHRSSVIWFGDDQSGRAVPPGVYFARIVAGEITVQEKIVHLR